MVRVDDLDERVSAALQNTDALLQLCFPTGQTIGFMQETNDQGHTITTSSPHITYIPTPLQAQVGGQIIEVPAFIPQTNPNHFNIVSYKGRYFIRNGYHRAAGLLRNNTQSQIIVSSILIEAQTLQQTGWQPGMFAEEVLFSDYPPYVADFWDETLSYEILQKPKRRVFRIRVDAFEVDESLE